MLLKFYNFLLVPMQAELWTEIQGAVTTLSDEQVGFSGSFPPLAGDAADLFS